MLTASLWNGFLCLWMNERPCRPTALSSESSVLSTRFLKAAPLETRWFIRRFPRESETRSSSPSPRTWWFWLPRGGEIQCPNHVRKNSWCTTHEDPSPLYSRKLPKNCRNPLDSRVTVGFFKCTVSKTTAPVSRSIILLRSHEACLSLDCFGKKSQKNGICGWPCDFPGTHLARWHWTVAGFIIP